MQLSQKTQYALRALLELAMRRGNGNTPVSEIARVQGIPPRFLEQILAQLRMAGLVESRRGVNGGYLLALDPRRLTVGKVIRFLEGPLRPVRYVDGVEAGGPVSTRCAFEDLWERAQEAVENVYDSTTFHDLIQEELSAQENYVANWVI